MAYAYTYKDFDTGKIRRTFGKFSRWALMGPLNTEYAVFITPKTRVYVPRYCLTQQSLNRIKTSGIKT